MSDLTPLLASLMLGRTVELPMHIDAEEIAHAADTNGATPLIAWQLRQNRDLIPRWDASAAIRERARTMTMMDIIGTRAVDDVITRMADAAIPALLIKGAALSRTHYVHTSLRPRCDADMFVSPRHADRASRTLEAAGFAQEPNSGGVVASRQRMWTRVDAAGLRHCIDLHFALSNRPRYADVLSFDELWNRGIPLQGTVRMPSPSDALLIAALHLAGHHRGQERLIWLYDIYLLHQSMNIEELDAVARRARTSRIDFELDAAIALALCWFGRGQPAPSFPPPGAITEFVDDLRQTHGLRRKLQLLREHLFPPAAYVMQKYGATRRASLPLLYTRRVLGAARRLWLMD